MRHPLLVAAFTVFAACAVSQTSMIRRSGKDGVLRVDPRGERPLSINSPLPYRQGLIPMPCVRDHAENADYYHWSENEGWVYRYSSARTYDKTGNLIQEGLFNRDTHQTLAEYNYRYDDQGRLTYSERLEEAELDFGKRQEREYYSYEDTTGILVRDSLATLEGDVWKTTFLRWWKLYRDEDGQLLTVTASSFEGRARNNDLISRLDYQNNRLYSITQSVFNAGFSSPVPAFRYVLDEPAGKDFSRFNSGIYKNGQWVEFRRDRSDSDGTVVSYLGEMINPEDDRRAHLNELESDWNGNLVRMTQRCYSDRSAAWDVVADIRFQIEYDPSGKEPASVTTTSRDSAGNSSNSVRVIFNPSHKVTRANGKLLVYPNPASGTVRIDWENTVGNHTRLQLLDESGKTVFERPTSSTFIGSELIDTEKFPVGNYTIRLVGEQNTIAKPLVIAR